MQVLFFSQTVDAEVQAIKGVVIERACAHLRALGVAPQRDEVLLVVRAPRDLHVLLVRHALRPVLALGVEQFCYCGGQQRRAVVRGCKGRNLLSASAASAPLKKQQHGADCMKQAYKEARAPINVQIIAVIQWHTHGDLSCLMIAEIEPSAPLGVGAHLAASEDTRLPASSRVMSSLSAAAKISATDRCSALHCTCTRL